METSTSEQQHNQDEYETYLNIINRNFQSISGPLFTTDATNLFPAYLRSLFAFASVRGTGRSKRLRAKTAKRCCME